MCGFAGEIACAANAAADADRALPMLQAILHRGPDGIGLWESEAGEACLLHARLAMVDLDGAPQPMTDANEEVVVVFNGEIYGFELERRALEAQGVVFRTRSDTEVLLQLYRQYGPDFVRDLEGEFAFVILDRRSGQAMLARDRFGVKPLFISQRNGMLLFGSEAKAILAHPWSERRLDPTILARELQGVYLPRDSLFAGISAVEPGNYMLVSRDRMVTRRYADLDPEAAGSLNISFEEATDALEAALSEAVTRRFRGDAAVGLFLSSGLDSGSIASLTRSAPAAPTSAFSIDFTGRGQSEYPAAATTARRLALRSVGREVDAAALEEAFATSVWHAETTTPNPHGTAKLLLARRARDDVKAVLTGEGADELHGGYAYFRHAALLADAAEGRDGGRLKPFLAQHGGRDGVLGAITPRLRRQLAWSDRGGTPYAAMRARVARWGPRFLMTSEFRRQGAGDASRALLDWLSVRAPGARILDDVTLSRFVALNTDLPRYNLAGLGDRVEMANGLEGRLPFLDRRVVDLLWRLPADFHQRDGESKRVLRALMARRLPDAVAEKKRAFLAPGGLSQGLLSGPLAQRWLSAEATRHAGMFRPAGICALRRWAQRPGAGGTSDFYVNAYLMMAMSAHLIADMFCDNFAATLSRRAPMSLTELRRRLGPSRRALPAVA